MSRIETLLNLLEQNPGDEFTKYALALEYVSLQETDNAEKYLKELIAVSPGYLATYYQYGKLLEDKGEVDEARKIYNQGLFVATSQDDLHTKAELQDALDNLF
ncbi:MAG: tetratricopeptide repeat protein [Bacteroidetes bacterium]|nr:tetratricopeptide repeat protein [Bacteroidota bacterium]